MTDSKKIVLIDGNSIMNRAFYGVPDLTNSEGLHTNAIFGFLNILFRVLEEEKPSHLMIAFDLKAPTFRHKMYDAYKGTRKPMLPELRQQMPVVKQILQAMNITIVEQEGIEADDILGTMAGRGEREDYTVVVISGDRDLLQLATEKVMIRIPKTKGGTTTIENYHTQDVIDKYQVTPSQIIDLKGLMGDSSDNIPGVPGIGEKTAVKILLKYDTVENAIEHIPEMPKTKVNQSFAEHVDLARLSKELATIKTDCELDVPIDEMEINDMFNAKAYEWIQRMEFKSMLSKFDGEMGSDEELEKTFRAIRTEQEAITFLKSIESGEPFACKAVMQEKEVIAVAVAYRDNENACIFVNEQLSAQTIQNIIRECVNRKCCLIGNDIKSQLIYLPVEKATECFDVGVAAYVVNPIRSSYHEEDIAMELAGMNMTPYQQVFGKMSYADASVEETEQFLKYFCYCVRVTLQCFDSLKETLQREEEGNLFYHIEMPLVFTLYEMERRGILVKRESLEEYGATLGKRLLELESSIYDKAGEEFNINSPKQLGIILFEKMHMPFAKKTKTGYSTSADILDKLRLEDPIIDEILEYRQLAKLKSTYADGLVNFIEEDGRIRTTFNQTITATGRISSTEPNLQNIPIRMELGRQIRKVFVPKEGYVFLDADYSQIELRVLAHMAGDEQLIDAYSKNADIHRTTAALVFHKSFDEVTELDRRNAKAVNFGIVYGISGFGLSRDLNITRKEAEKYIQDYFATYPKVKEFMDALVEKGKTDGYVTTMFGRRRPIPELSSGNFMQRQFGERVAMNSPIQGTAADIIKIAMIRVNERLKRENKKSQLILQIHDELLIETKQDEIDEVAEILQEEMEKAASLRVQLVAEVQQGNDWYNAK